MATEEEKEALLSPKQRQENGYHHQGNGTQTHGANGLYHHKEEYGALDPNSSQSTLLRACVFSTTMLSATAVLTFFVLLTLQLDKKITWATWILVAPLCGAFALPLLVICVLLPSMWRRFTTTDASEFWLALLFSTCGLGASLLLLLKLRGVPGFQDMSYLVLSTVVSLPFALLTVVAIFVVFDSFDPAVKCRPWKWGIEEIFAICIPKVLILPPVFFTFTACKLDGIVDWPWGSVFVPLYVVLGLGTCILLCWRPQFCCISVVLAVQAALINGKLASSWVASWSLVLLPVWILSPCICCCLLNDGDGEKPARPDDDDQA